MSETNTLTDDQNAKLPELSQVVDLLTAIQAKQNQDSTDKEVVAKLSAKVEELAGQISKGAAPRRGEFDTVDADRLIHDKKVPGGFATLKTIMDSTSQDPDIISAQEVLDRSYILSEITGKPVSELKYFRENLSTSKLLQKALDKPDLGNAGVGGALTGWQPAVFTQRMIEKVRLQLVVGNLHPTINMPADPYRFPVEGNDAAAYIASERGGADDSLTAANLVPVGLSSTGSSHITLATTKLGARLAVSNEAEEDSFIPIIGYLEDKLALCMAEARENVTINGCITGSSLDTQSGLYTASNPSGQLRAWSGYRKFLEDLGSSVKISNGGTSTIDIAKIREIRAGMGKYAINPKDLVIVCGPQGYIKLLGIKDGTNPSPVLTLDKYGPQATVLNGELAKVDGIPILVSSMVGPYLNAAGSGTGAENLNASGIFDAVTTTFTELLFVRPSAMTYGDRRQATLKSREIIETDQQVLVVLQRLTFANLYPGEKVVGGLYNILK